MVNGRFTKRRTFLSFTLVSLGTQIRKENNRQGAAIQSSWESRRGWFVGEPCGNHLCCNPITPKYGDGNAYGDAMRRIRLQHNGSAAHIAAIERIWPASVRSPTVRHKKSLSNLSIEKLAEVYGVSKTTIADYSAWRSIQADRRCQLFGVSVWRPAA